MKKLLDWIGGVAAFLTVVVYVLLMVHGNWAFLPEAVYNILVVVKFWAPLAVVAIVGLEFVSNKPFIVKLIFYIMVAGVVIFMFFPGTWNQFVGIVNGAIK